MDCKEIQSRLTDFEDGTLPAAEMERVKIHLSECGGCAKIRGDLSNIWQTLGDLPAAEPDPFAIKRFFARLNAKRAKKKIALAVSAAVASAVFCIGWWYRPQNLTFDTSLSQLSILPDFTTNDTSSTEQIEFRMPLGQVSGPFQQAIFETNEEENP